MPILPEIPDLRKFDVFGRESVNFSGISSKFSESAIFSGKVIEEIFPELLPNFLNRRSFPKKFLKKLIKSPSDDSHEYEPSQSYRCALLAPVFLGCCVI